jgi:signal transduction histidine kinase
VTRRRRHRWSLLVKLIAVLIVGGVAIYAVLFAGFRAVIDRDDRTERLGVRNFRKYIAYVREDLGWPPTNERLRAWSDDVGIEVRIEVPGGASWSSNPALPAWSDLGTSRRAKRFENRWGVPAGYDDGRFFLSTQTAQARYTFFTPVGIRPDVREEVIAALVAAILAILIAMFYATKRLLKPLEHLHGGVNLVAAGNYDVTLKANGHDELAELTRAFNDMATKVRESFKAREQLLLDVSHELRSPMTRMKLALEFMDSGKTKQSLADDLAAMERMTTAILESARLGDAGGRPPLVSVDLAKVVHRVAGLVAGRAPGLDTSRVAATAMVAADPDLLLSVVTNVIENALKFSAAAKLPVEIALSSSPASEGSVGDPSVVVLTVHDHGVGIPEDDLERVFEPFYRVDKSRSQETGGFGLGLSLSRRIMTAFGGTIALGRGPNGIGTVATLTFSR